MTDDIIRLKELTKDIFGVEAELQKINEQKDLLIEIFTVLNFFNSEIDSIEAILTVVKNYTGVEAAAIRIEDDGDYPYYAVRGFPDEFVKLEDSLCGTSNDSFECLCGCVILDCAADNYSFFTNKGSFFTGNSSALIASGEIPKGINLRGTCVKFGYETIVLVPLRSKDRIIGLLQLNDKKLNAVSEETVGFLEGAGQSIGVALERIRLLERLKEECYGGPNKNNELQVNG